MGVQRQLKIITSTVLALLLPVSLGQGFISFCHAQSETPGPQVTVTLVAVMPLTKGKYGMSMDETLDSPLFLFSSNPGDVADDADRVLTEYVYNKMVTIHGGRVVPLEKTIEIYFNAPRDATNDTIRSLARQTGELLKANVIMTGYVWEYKKRIGGTRAASSPASVGFTLVLIETANGRLLWNGRHVEKQQALSENLLGAKTFFDRGGKWLTVDELAQYGVSAVFKKYPYR